MHSIFTYYFQMVTHMTVIVDIIAYEFIVSHKDYAPRV